MSQRAVSSRACSTSGGKSTSPHLAAACEGDIGFAKTNGEAAYLRGRAGAHRSNAKLWPLEPRHRVVPFIVVTRRG